MITKRTAHLGFRAEDARLCELAPCSWDAAVAQVSYLTVQLGALPKGAQLCQTCLSRYWNAAEASGVQH